MFGIFILFLYPSSFKLQLFIDGVMFADTICWYLVESFFSSTCVTLPVTLAAKVFFSRKCGSSLPPNEPLVIVAKTFYFNTRTCSKTRQASADDSLHPGDVGGDKDTGSPTDFSMKVFFVHLHGDGAPPLLALQIKWGFWFHQQLSP